MVAPVKHSVGSTVGTMATEGVKGGLWSGIVGAITGTLIGAAVIGVAGLAVGGLGGVIFGGGVDIVKSIATGTMANAGALTASAAATGAMVLGGIGAVVGAVGGLFSGTFAGGVVGTAVGVVKGSRRVSAEGERFEEISKSASHAKGQLIAGERAKAAEQYTQVGYGQGFQDGQAVVVNQLMQAQEQMMAEMQQHQAAEQKKSFVAKLEAEKQHAANKQLGA